MYPVTKRSSKVKLIQTCQKSNTGIKNILLDTFRSGNRKQTNPLHLKGDKEFVRARFTLDSVFR